MLRLVRKIVFVAGREQLPRYAALILMMLAAALLEAVGIGAVLPLLIAMSQPEALLEHAAVQSVFLSLGLPPDSWHLVLVVGAAVIGVFSFKGLLVVVTTWFQGEILHKQRAVLSRILFAHYLQMPYDQYIRKNMAHVLHVISGVTANFSSVLMAALLLLGAESLVCLTIVALLLLVNPPVTLAAVLVLAVTGTAYALWSKPWLIRVGDEQHRATVGLNKSVIESLGSLKETRLHAAEAFFLRRFDRLARRYRKYSVQLHVLNHAPRLVAETFFVVLIVGIVMFMGATGVDLKVHLPVMAVFALAFARLLPSFNRMLGAYNSARVTAVSLNVLFEELGEARRFPANTFTSAPEGLPPPGMQRELRLIGVSYAYPGEAAKALDNVSVAIRNGEVVGLVGKSGAGKTTLVDVILGLLRPNAGDVLVDGASILDRLHEWHAKVGYIPQSVYLLDDSIRRNIAFGIDDELIDDDRVRRACDTAQLGDFIATLPRGLDTAVGDRGVRLSGGQRQRVGIARALYRDPELLVLDEATSALDVETETAVNDAIRNLARSKTIVIIAHRLSTVRICNRLFLMDAGRLADSGTYEELLGRNAWFRQINEIIE